MYERQEKNREKAAQEPKKEDVMVRKSFKGLKIQVPRKSVGADEERSASKIAYDESACKILPECAKLLNPQNMAAPTLSDPSSSTSKISEELSDDENK